MHPSVGYLLLATYGPTCPPALLAPTEDNASLTLRANSDGPHQRLADFGEGLQQILRTSDAIETISRATTFLDDFSPLFTRSPEHLVRGKKDNHDLLSGFKRARRRRPRRRRRRTRTAGHDGFLDSVLARWRPHFLPKGEGGMLGVANDLLDGSDSFIQKLRRFILRRRRRRRSRATGSRGRRQRGGNAEPKNPDPNSDGGKAQDQIAAISASGDASGDDHGSDDEGGDAAGSELDDGGAPGPDSDDEDEAAPGSDMDDAGGGAPGPDSDDEDEAAPSSDMDDGGGGDPSLEYDDDDPGSGGVAPGIDEGRESAPDFDGGSGLGQ